MNSNHGRWMMRMMIVFIIVMMGVLNTTQLALADDSVKITGIWKLVSFDLEIQATGEGEPAMGKNSTGYAIFTPEGRAMFVLTGEGRKAPKTDQDRADLFKSMFAYTGMYRLEGDKWITKVDVSWNPAWLGTEQIRFFRVDGDRLQVISMWMKDTVNPQRGMVRGILTFDRVK